MNSSQTLTTPSSSFPTFQSSHSLSLHYPLDSPKSLPISKSNRHQSPLQPLNLNPSPTTIHSYPHGFSKHHNTSPATTATQQPLSYPSPSSKQIQFPAHNSTTAQKNPQNHLLGPQKTYEGLQSPLTGLERESSSICSSGSKSSCEGGCPAAGNEQSYLNVNKNRKEGPRSALKENCRESIKQQLEVSWDSQENQEMRHGQVENHFGKALSLKSTENSGNLLRLVMSDKNSQGLFGSDQHRAGLFPHERVMSEKILSVFDETSNQSTFGEGSIGRLRTCSMGDSGLETLEMPKVQVLASRSQNNGADSLKIRMQLSDQDFTTDPLKKKKVRQCLNVLCFTDPKDSSLWSKQKVMNSTICKACYDAFKHGQYCFFCYQIYLDGETSASNDGKDWIECDGCNRWNHIECEAVHGLKEIRTLLQGHENTYNYYCPICRDDRAAKAISKKMKALMRSPVLAKSNSCQKTLTIKRQALRNQGAPQRAEDVMDVEDNTDEPFGKKIKTNSSNEVCLSLVEIASTKSKEKELNGFMSPLDLAKKKLDSIFQRNNANKKRIQKPEPVDLPGGNIGAFSDIDKLMTLYAGKRIQLSDSEIRADLDLFRELSKTSTCHSEDKSNGSEMGMEVSTDFNGEGGEDLNSIPRDARMRMKIQRKMMKSRGKEINYNENSVRDSEDTKEDDENKDETFESKRLLRSRKRLE